MAEALEGTFTTNVSVIPPLLTKTTCTEEKLKRSTARVTDESTTFTTKISNVNLYKFYSLNCSISYNFDISINYLCVFKKQK